MNKESHISKEETVRGQTRFRTGQYFSFRKCPKHGTELELCINDTDYSTWSVGHQLRYNHHCNRIEWRCDECLMFWNENYFIRTHFPVHIQLPSAQLLLLCPHCGSKRMTHDCVPECCTTHYCIDCQARFSAQITVTQPGQQKNMENHEDERENEEEIWGDVCPSSCRYTATDTTMTGIMRSYRTCPDHDGDEPLELVFCHEYAREYVDPAWYCRRCQRIYLERGLFRPVYQWFSYEAHATVVCPTCHSCEIQSLSIPTKEGSSCTCLLCGAVLEVRLFPQKETAVLE